MATMTLAHVAEPASNTASSSPTTTGHIRQFLEKPSWGEVFSDTINTGIYVLDPEYLQLLRARQALRLQPGALPHDAGEG